MVCAMAFMLHELLAKRERLPSKPLWKAFIAGKRIRENAYKVC
jgi:hypothetical protein